MNILAIDTSTNVLGIGLANEERIIGEYITNIKRNHSTRVMPAIDFLLKDCGFDIKDINKIVVAKGPGSYTGLRIGVTIGKTLAWTLNIPISAVSSLKLMAASSKHFNGLISPLMDGRRGNIFTALFQFQDGKLTRIEEDQYISTKDWAEKLKEFGKPVLFIGNDLPIHKSVLEENLIDFARFSEIGENNPRPGELAILGRDAKEENAHSIVPNYVRLAEAEAKWRENNRQ